MVSAPGGCAGAGMGGLSPSPRRRGGAQDPWVGLDWLSRSLERKATDGTETRDGSRGALDCRREGNPGSL